MTRRAENGGKAGKSNSRSERLAAALRENLRRRKAQERAREKKAEQVPREGKDR